MDKNLYLRDISNARKPHSGHQRFMLLILVCAKNNRECIPCYFFRSQIIINQYLWCQSHRLSGDVRCHESVAEIQHCGFHNNLRIQFTPFAKNLINFPVTDI